MHIFTVHSTQQDVCFKVKDNVIKPCCLGWRLLAPFNWIPNIELNRCSCYFPYYNDHYSFLLVNLAFGYQWVREGIPDLKYWKWWRVYLAEKKVAFLIFQCSFKTGPCAFLTILRLTGALKPYLLGEGGQRTISFCI